MSDDVGQFVDGLIKDAGNTETVKANDTAVKPAKEKTAPNPSDNASAAEGADHFDDSEYKDEDEGGDAFDHEKIDAARKLKWPKKYANAMSRRDKDNARLRSENQAFQQRLAAMEGGKQQPNGAAETSGAAGADQTKQPAKSAAMWELESKKPDLNKFKDWAEYQDALMNFNLEMRELKQAEAKAATEAQTGKVKITAEQQAAIAQNETRIVQQAKEVIAKNPEVYQLMQQNADLIDSLPQPIINIIGSLQSPIVAMMEIVQHPGALEAMRHLTPAQAAQVLFNAQAQGLAKANGQASGGDDEGDDQPDGGQAEVKKVSGAPAPMKAAKGSPSGKRALHQLNADELFKELDL